MIFYIGVDLHKTQFTVHVRTEEMVESLNEIRMYPVTEADYAVFCKRIRLYKETGAVVKLAVESTGNIKHFKNQMEKAGAEVTVVNTVKFKVINESVSKTDKHDAATLSEFLKDYKLPESYLCSKETENMRRLIKSRERLVRAHVGQKNEIHALLVSLGFADELRTCLKSSQKNRYEGQYDELQCSRKGTFAVLPKSPLFFKPCKTSLYDPPFGNNCKCMQFIAFDYLYRYPLS